jgi:hypothetical protein
MSCRRSFEIDLPGFLAEPAREEFAEFRAHYPACAECSLEVSAWSDVVTQLRESAPSGNGVHPEAALLLRYEDDAAGLPPERCAEIERHLATCPTCRDELGALRAFPFESLAPRRESARRRDRGWLPRVRGLVLHPAFAYALVAVLLWPAGLTLMRSRDFAPAPGPVPAPAEQIIALESKRAPAAAPVEETVARERAEELERLLAKLPDARSRVAKLQAADEGASGLTLGRTAAAKEAANAPTKAEPTARPAAAPVPVQPSATTSAVRTGHEALFESAPPDARAREARVPSEPEIRVAIPVALRGADEIEVRVRDLRGLRELRERVRAPQHSPLSIRLPADWPAQPRYSVELRELGEAGAREPVFRFDVER